MLALYFNGKNVVKKEHKRYIEILLSEIGSLWIPTQYGALDIGSEWISYLIAKADL